MPNLLVILADDLGVDKVRSYAGDTVLDTGSSSGTYVDDTEFLPATPTLDDLAANGLRFTRAWANPMCTPTRAALLTGEHPSRLGDTEAGRALSETAAGLDPMAHAWLPAELKAAGYVAGFFGKWHLGAEGSAGTTDWSRRGPYAEDSHPVRAGFDRFRGELGGYIEDFSNWELVDDTPQLHHAVSTTTTTWAATDATDTAVEWIWRQHAPWFAVVSYPIPHASHRDSRFEYDDVDVSCVTTPALAACLASAQAGGPGCYDSRGLERMADAAYQGLVECLDTEVARLLAGVRDLEDTVVVFLGDNGSPYEVGEGRFHASGRGKTSTYESGVRVPLLVAEGARYAGVPSARWITAPGRTTAVSAQVVDVYATILELGTGVAPAGGDGRSFADCLAQPTPFCGRGSGPRGLTYEEYGYAETFTYADSGRLGKAKAAVRFGPQYKLVIVWDSVRECLSTEMYDTVADFYETTPLSSPKGALDDMRAWFLGDMDPPWAENPATGLPWPWC